MFRWIVLAFFFIYPFKYERETRAFQLKGHAQGTTWHITYFSADSIVSQRSIDSLLQGIDSSMSLYKAYSRIVKFNNSNHGVAIDSHFKKVINKALEVSEQTKGLFDVTVGPLVKAWGFGPDQSSNTPDKKKLDSLMQCVGYKNVSIRGDSLLKSRSCIGVDVNGIAQGYTVDVLASFLDRLEVQNYVVEIGGEVKVKGRRQPGGEVFKVAIEVPGDDQYSMESKVIELRSGALTTSGSYRRYIERNGQRRSHLIDPRTGRSADNEMISVTVVATDAMTADAYDNALMLMGVKKALRFVERKPDLGVFIVYRDKDRRVKQTMSRRFKRIVTEQ